MNQSNSFPFCQTPIEGGKAASCGACCGMYNWRGFSREMVFEILSRQTELFENWDGSDGGIEKIREDLAGSMPEKLCPMIINCEFLGFLDEARTRVGCLFHPSRNNRNNLRNFSKHGRETCDEARCSAYHYLSSDLAMCVAEAVPDWYLYGLCLTDIDLVMSFFDAAGDLAGETIHPSRILASPSLLELFSGYLLLKETWPLARDPGRFGKYYFPEGAYKIAAVDYQGLGLKPSRYDKILMSLGSVIQGSDDLLEAEGMIEEKIKSFARAYSGGHKA
jgi:hypothetical protein